jgi:hypothetical protein
VEKPEIPLSNNSIFVWYAKKYFYSYETCERSRNFLVNDFKFCWF